MKKAISAIILALVATGILAACTSDSKNNTPKVQIGDSTTTTQAPVQQAPVTTTTQAPVYKAPVTTTTQAPVSTGMSITACAAEGDSIVAEGNRTSNENDVITAELNSIDPYSSSKAEMLAYVSHARTYISHERVYIAHSRKWYKDCGHYAPSEAANASNKTNVLENTLDGLENAVDAFYNLVSSM